MLLDHYNWFKVLTTGQTLLTLKIQWNMCVVQYFFVTKIQINDCHDCLYRYKWQYLDGRVKNYHHHLQ